MAGPTAGLIPVENDPQETSNEKIVVYGEDTRCSDVLAINGPSDFGRG
jgi:hypothetical protein